MFQFSAIKVKFLADLEIVNLSQQVIDAMNITWFSSLFQNKGSLALCAVKDDDSDLTVGQSWNVPVRRIRNLKDVLNGVTTEKYI